MMAKQWLRFVSGHHVQAMNDLSHRLLDLGSSSVVVTLPYSGIQCWMNTWCAPIFVCSSPFFHTAHDESIKAWLGYPPAPGCTPPPPLGPLATTTLLGSGISTGGSP